MSEELLANKRLIAGKVVAPRSCRGCEEKLPAGSVAYHVAGYQEKSSRWCPKCADTLPCEKVVEVKK